MERPFFFFLGGVNEDFSFFFWKVFLKFFCKRKDEAYISCRFFFLSWKR